MRNNLIHVDFYLNLIFWLSHGGYICTRSPKRLSSVKRTLSGWVRFSATTRRLNKITARRNCCLSSNCRIQFQSRSLPIQILRKWYALIASQCYIWALFKAEADGFKLGPYTRFLTPPGHTGARPSTSHNYNCTAAFKLVFRAVFRRNFGWRDPRNVLWNSSHHLPLQFDICQSTPTLTRSRCREESAQ